MVAGGGGGVVTSLPYNKKGDYNTQTERAEREITLTHAADV